MDLLIEVGISALLSVLRTKKDVRKWEASIAKVYVKIENVAKLDQQLSNAIEMQRNKEGAR